MDETPVEHDDGDHHSWGVVMFAIVAYTIFGSLSGVLAYIALPPDWPLVVVAPIIILAGFAGGWFLNYAWIMALNTALEGLAEHAE